MTKKIYRIYGLTLIELVIAMALGLLISAAILHLFASAKHSYRVQSAAGSLHNNARFALDFIGQHIRLAGFRGLLNNQAAEPADIFAVDAAAGFGLAGQIISGRDDDDTTPDVNEERISVRYRGAGAWYGASPMLDCYGNTVPPGSTVTLSFRLNSDNALVCAVAGGVPSNQPLVQGVEDLEIWYGVDTDHDNSVNAYVSSAAIETTPALSWHQVKAVKIALLFASDPDSAVTASGQSYFFAQNSPDPFSDTAVVAKDKRLRRVFTTTIYLRNPSS